MFRETGYDAGMESQLKNIPMSAVLALPELVSCLPGQISSVTLSTNEWVRITLFAFSQGESLSTHSAGGDALVQVLEGQARIVIDGREYRPAAGESIVMPARVPHSVHAESDFKMLLTVVFPPRTQF